MFKLLTEVSGPELWSCMMRLAWIGRAELDHIRASQIYALYTCVFRRANSTNSIWTCITQCRIRINLNWFMTKPKMDKLILLAYNKHFDTDANSSHFKKRKKECLSFKCSVPNAIRLQFHRKLWREHCSSRGGLLRIFQYILYYDLKSLHKLQYVSKHN